MKKILSILILVLVGSGCSDDNDNMRPVPQPSPDTIFYVWSYSRPRSEQLSCHFEQLIDTNIQYVEDSELNVEKKNVLFTFGDAIGSTGGNNDMIGKMALIRDSVSRVFKDYTWNKSLGEPFSGASMYIQTDSIVVTADKDLGTYLAGSSLNDCFDILFRSAEEFVLNGYKEDDYMASIRVELPVLKDYYREPLNVFNEKNRTLIPFFFYFQPTRLPESNETVRYTITYKNVQGEIIQGTTRAIILK